MKKVTVDIDEGAKVKIRKSSSGKGWHIYIEGVRDYSFRQRIAIRILLGDDLWRIVSDIRRHEKGKSTDLLFDTKIDISKGTTKNAGKWLMLD